MKLIIDIPKGTYEAVKVGIINQVLEYKVWNAIRNGTPLDDVKAEITDLQGEDYFIGFNTCKNRVLEIIENIGKAESEKGKSCSTCKNNDDEFSGECYECLKGIFDHYEAESEDI